MKRYWLVSVLCMGVLLLGSVMIPPALALVTNTVQDQVPGSLLVYPIFDIFAPNRTKIEITNRAGIGSPTIDLRVRVTYMCQPVTGTTASAFCQSFDENFPITHNQ